MLSSPSIPVINVDIVGELNSHVSERLSKSHRPEASTNSPSAGNLELKLNPDIRRYVRQQEEIERNAEEGDWLKRPEIPTNEEVALLPDEEVELVPNKVQGKWKSKDRYLRAHFELQREDGLSPLRDAVDRFKEDPDMMDDHSMSIYEKVR